MSTQRALATAPLLPSPCCCFHKPPSGCQLPLLQKSEPQAAVLHEQAAALLRALPKTVDRYDVTNVLAAVTALGDARLAEQCLAALSTVRIRRGQSLQGSLVALQEEHAPAIVGLCQLSAWSAQCVSAMHALLARLLKAGTHGLRCCVPLLRNLRAVATATEGEAAVGAAAAQAGTAAAAAAEAQPGSSSIADRTGAAALLSTAVTQLISGIADLQWKGTLRGTSTSNSKVCTQREQQAEFAAMLTVLLSFLEQLGDEAALQSFLLQAFARHFIAAKVVTSWQGHIGMLPALLAACQRYGWGSQHTAAVLTATAAACAAAPGGSGDFLELTKAVQAAAGEAADVLLPQLTAAFLGVLPELSAANWSDSWADEISWAQVRAASLWNVLYCSCHLISGNAACS